MLVICSPCQKSFQVICLFLRSEIVTLFPFLNFITGLIKEMDVLSHTLHLNITTSDSEHLTISR